MVAALVGTCICKQPNI